MGTYAETVLRDGAELTIYVGASIDVDQNTHWNDGGIPSNLIIFSKGSILNLDQNAHFYGVLYAPNATYNQDQNSEMYGSIITGSIKIDQNACWHYDRDLANYRNDP